MWDEARQAAAALLRAVDRGDDSEARLVASRAAAGDATSEALQQVAFVAVVALRALSSASGLPVSEYVKAYESSGVSVPEPPVPFFVDCELLPVGAN